MSNSKDAVERKKEILDIAEKLFIANGYENTSTTDILQQVGIARGTLYYHFKSKEEILDALIDRIIQQIVCKIEHSILNKTSSVQRLIAFTKNMKVDSAIGKEIIDYAHKPQNALMHQKINSSLLKVLTPIATQIIQDGIKEGCFSTPYPQEVAEMLLIYSNIAFDDLNTLKRQDKKKKIEAFVFNMECLLGIKSGSLSKMCQYIK